MRVFRRRLPSASTVAMLRNYGRLATLSPASGAKSFYSAASTRFFFPPAPRRASTGFKNAPV
jgi:hypothetical protein